MPLPSSRVTVRVNDEAGAAIAGAIVQLLPRGAGDAPEFVAADAKGNAYFNDLPPGALRFSAYADGFKPAVVPVAEEQRASIVIVVSAAR